MQLYERFGIEHKNGNFYIGGECVGNDCLYNNEHMTRWLLQNAEFKKLTARYIAELADIGFMTFNMVICYADTIELIYDSPYTDYYVGAVVVSDQSAAAKIYINGNDWKLAEFEKHYPRYMDVLEHMKKIPRGSDSKYPCGFAAADCRRNRGGIYYGIAFLCRLNSRAG